MLSLNFREHLREEHFSGHVVEKRRRALMGLRTLSFPWVGIVALTSTCRDKPPQKVVKKQRSTFPHILAAWCRIFASFTTKVKMSSFGWDPGLGFTLGSSLASRWGAYIPAITDQHVEVNEYFLWNSYVASYLIKNILLITDNMKM